MSRLFKLSSVLLVFALFASACGPSATPAPTATEGAAPMEEPATEEPAPTETPVPAGFVREVPRNRTFRAAGWDITGAQLPSPENFSPYNGVLLHQRNILHYTVNELLFYYNLSKGELVPWQGEGFEYNDTYDKLTIKLRKGVTWSDGEPFTADDVVFTFNMLKESSPELPLSSAIEDTVQDAVAVDDLTVEITLTRPNPRWAIDYLATGQTTRFVVVPEHIWRGKDPTSFTFYDLEKGWPVGTGPYRLVRTGSLGMFFDLRDTWWAVETGLVPEMPAVERIVYLPYTRDALPEMYIGNELDQGRSLSIGEFEAARAQNPNMVSWHDSGPVWGAPDGCSFRLTINNQKEPFDDPEIRRALNYAIDREQLVNLGLEGSTFTAVAPFSSYGGVQAYVENMQDLFDEIDVDGPDIEIIEEILTGKGYTRDDEGFWVKPDGERWQISLYSQEGRPLGPILAQQLRDAGFDVANEVIAGAGFTDAATSGEFELHAWTHCGSGYDPWQTLEHYHSKYAAPPGEPVSNLRAYARHANPELDTILDQMEAMKPSPDDSEYMDLVRRATEIYLTNLPDITLAEELWPVTLNTTYWVGWPSAEDPYTQPYLPWEGYNLMIHRLEPAQ
jgi:peptide/nickel transport system substrate-binding protein